MGEKHPITLLIPLHSKAVLEEKLSVKRLLNCKSCVGEQHTACDVRMTRMGPVSVTSRIDGQQKQARDGSVSSRGWNCRASTKLEREVALSEHHATGYRVITVHATIYSHLPVASEVRRHFPLSCHQCVPIPRRHALATLVAGVCDGG